MQFNLFGGKVLSNTFKVAIVGGGASGLICAIELLSGNDALLGDDIVILERCDRVGKKLIATGNGQGNLTNISVNVDNYHGDKGFIRAFMSAFKSADLIEYLKNIGIYLVEGDEGKMYPISMQASSVLDIFRNYLEYKGCKILTDCYVEKIQKNNEVFTLSSVNADIKAENVVCAFGGAAGKQYGTEGSSYKLLESLGHKTTKLYPSLVQLKADLQDLKGLKGVKEKVKVTAFSGEKELANAYGELLFTDYGVSGSAIFKISGALQGVEKPTISIEFLPHLNYNELLKILREKAFLKHLKQEELLNGLVNKQIGKIICKHSDSLMGITNNLKDYRLTITGNLGFNYAQVTKGGIDTDLVNPFTLQSKIIKNLYLAGELLSVDGDCGGYNLTFAFLSGIGVARSVKKRYTSEKNFYGKTY